MPVKTRRFCWDSSVFLSYVNADPERLPAIEAVLLSATREQLEIVTSVVTIAEVAFAVAERTGKALLPDVAAKINALWQPGAGAPVKLVKVHRLIALDAQSMIQVVLGDEWRLKPMDAIHLSIARRMSVAEFHTYDKPFSKYAGQSGFVISEPSIVQPALPEGPGTTGP